MSIHSVRVADSLNSQQHIMPLPVDLTTNEVKDRAGAEVEFLHFSCEGRAHIYQKKDANPSLQQILRVEHAESGAGSEKVRRSVVRVDVPVTGTSGKIRKVSAYKVIVIPVGDVADLNAAKDASAMLDSFCATTGAATTVLFDGSGNGNYAAINGTL